MSSITILLPEGATVVELARRLTEMGFDLSTGDLITTLDGRGLGQWPSDRPITSDDDVALFSRISGGETE